MEDDLIRRLEKLPAPQWTPRGPGDERELARLEEKFGLRLPEDYRRLMLHSDGGGICGRSGCINYESAEGLEEQNSDERFLDALPGMFVVGDDGGGSVFFFDPHDRLGRGPYALFMVHLSTLRISYCIFVGRTFSEAAGRVLAGEELHTLPYHGKDL